MLHIAFSFLIYTSEAIFSPFLPSHHPLNYIQPYRNNQVCPKQKMLLRPSYRRCLKAPMLGFIINLLESEHRAPRKGFPPLHTARYKLGACNPPGTEAPPPAINPPPAHCRLLPPAAHLKTAEHLPALRFSLSFRPARFRTIATYLKCGYRLLLLLMTAL